jgi:CheY-specific phosphatase CheX
MSTSTHHGGASGTTGAAGWANPYADAFGGADPVLAIAEEVFAAMIDGEPGVLRPWAGPLPDPLEPMYAWVDVGGPMPGRVLLGTDRYTATLLTRALLAMGEDEPVGDEDFSDALGEVANVVGGNVKSLVPEAGALTLPTVTHEAPPRDPSALLYELPLAWRGRAIVVSLWQLPG